jgi:hypothetical protein
MIKRSTITPVRTTFNLANNAICTYGPPNILIGNIPAHGMTSPGDWFVLSGVTANVGPFTPAMLNGPHQVTTVLTTGTFLFACEGATVTTAGLCGGGATMKAEFQIPTGLDSAVVGTGWGIPPWGGGNNQCPGMTAPTYDVYFGTTASPPFRTNTSLKYWEPGTLQDGVKYYWKIIAKDGFRCRLCWRDGPAVFATVRNRDKKNRGFARLGLAATSRLAIESTSPSP